MKKIFGYVILLFLTNALYSSVGLPVSDIDGSYGPLAKSLQLLANHCENSFLSTQIKSKLNACNISLSAQKKTSEPELECFIFYDINSQLCAAFRDSKLDLRQKYAAAIEKVQNVDTICNESKNWKFTKLAEFPNYNMSERAFKTTVSCLKACGVDDILSEDTNFYCKYYQWGMEMLQASQPAIPLSGSVPSGNSAVGPVPVETASKPQNIATQPTSTNVNNVAQQILALNNPGDPVKVESSGPEPPNNVAKPQLAPNTGHSASDKVNTPKAQDPQKGDSAGLLENVSPVNVLDIPNKLEVPPNKEADNPPDSSDVKPDLQNQSNQNAQNLEENDDFGEFDSPDDALQDTSGSVNGLEADPVNPNEQKTKTPSKDIASIVSAVNVELTHREYYSNTMQDGFAEDDDHFFSFFLTAIVLAVVLYVLYHNKSKFRKVFLGLLVEGRQAGRRRNSRGHEYRRLDTLEQAMSTNSAAPPSKIIY